MRGQRTTTREQTPLTTTKEKPTQQQGPSTIKKKKKILENQHKGEKPLVIHWRSFDINNLRYADDTTLKAESEEELKSLLMKVRGQ